MLVIRPRAEIRILEKATKIRLTIIVRRTRGRPIDYYYCFYDRRTARWDSARRDDRSRTAGVRRDLKAPHARRV